MVVLKGSVKPGAQIDYMLDIVTDINLKHDTLISIYPVSKSSFETVKSPFFMNVKREGVSV